MKAYARTFDALGDQTRRAVLESLRSGPRSVGEIAARMPVSRPAVSQHLRVLKEAGLVVERPEGTRRMYSVDPNGLSALRAYLESYWIDVLGAFAGAAGREARNPARKRRPEKGRKR